MKCLVTFPPGTISSATLISHSLGFDGDRINIDSFTEKTGSYVNDINRKSFPVNQMQSNVLMHRRSLVIEKSAVVSWYIDTF